jgi:hypothetical protein
MAKQRNGERETFWREQVRRQAASRLSVRGFCEEKGLSEPSFYAWRRTLAQRDQAIQVPEFVPVMIAPHVASSSSRFTIELRGGRVVHLPETMATERVVALLRGLEASEVTP